MIKKGGFPPESFPGVSIEIADSGMETGNAAGDDEMKNLKKKFGATGIRIVSFIAVIAMAISPMNAASVEAAPEGNPDVPAEGEVPVEEQGTWIQQNLAQCRSCYQNVGAMLEKARADKDAIKITCLEDKLGQLQANVAGAEERAVAWNASSSSGNAGEANQQFTVLSLLVGKIKGIQQEAQKCVGDSDTVQGQSETTVKVDKNISEENPSNKGQNVYQNVGVDQMPHASGYF